jgi:hypothetical protein
VTLPFGRHRGADLADVPAGYLAWLLEEATLRSDVLREAIRAELAERLELEPRTVTVAVPARPPAALAPAVRQIVTAGFRAVTRKAHPDVGGSTALMRDAIAARAWLETLTA